MIRKNPSTCILALVMVSGFTLGKEKTIPTEKKPGSAQKMEVFLPDVLGTTHVAGRYYHTKKDYLTEGADEVLARGSRVI